jgi:hypothetical protein
MHTKLSLAAALSIAAAIVTGAATAGHTAARQRIAITTASGNSATFALTPLTTGPIMRDSGTATACCWTRRFIQRDGQAIEIDNPLRTFVGKRGTFTWRGSIAWVNPGKGYYVGTGTWKIVHGTGSYAHLEGHGRLATITGPADQDVTNRAEGLVDLGG